MAVKWMPPATREFPSKSGWETGARVVVALAMLLCTSSLGLATVTIACLDTHNVLTGLMGSVAIVSGFVASWSVLP